MNCEDDVETADTRLYLAFTGFCLSEKLLYIQVSRFGNFFKDIQKKMEMG